MSGITIECSVNECPRRATLFALATGVYFDAAATGWILLQTPRRPENYEALCPDHTDETPRGN